MAGTRSINQLWYCLVCLPGSNREEREAAIVERIKPSAMSLETRVLLCEKLRKTVSALGGRSPCSLDLMSSALQKSNQPNRGPISHLQLKLNDGKTIDAQNVQAFWEGEKLDEGRIELYLHDGRVIFAQVQPQGKSYADLVSRRAQKEGLIFAVELSLAEISDSASG